MVVSAYVVNNQNTLFFNTAPQGETLKREFVTVGEKNNAHSSEEKGGKTENSGGEERVKE